MAYNGAVVVDAHRERCGDLTVSDDVGWMVQRGVEATRRVDDLIFDIKCGRRLC